MTLGATACARAAVTLHERSAGGVTLQSTCCVDTVDLVTRGAFNLVMARYICRSESGGRRSLGLLGAHLHVKLSQPLGETQLPPPAMIRKSTPSTLNLSEPAHVHCNPIASACALVSRVSPTFAQKRCCICRVCPNCCSIVLATSLPFALKRRMPLRRPVCSP